MLSRPLLSGRRATLAASLCLSALASLCLVPSVWRPAEAARAASLAGCAAFDLNAARHLAVGMRPSDAAAGDFNGDGRQDIVVANGGSTFVSVLFGSAAGVFTATSVEVGAGARAAVADFNNDGEDDLLVSRTQSVAVRLGDGAGGFGPLVESAHGAGSASPLVVADFNNDGKRDVFVGSESFSSSKVLLGDGAGAFGASGTLQIPAHSFADAGDFDGDGKTDLVLTGGGNFFFLAPGDGAGNFTQEILFTVPTSGPVAATDLNGDSKLDVLTAGGGSVVVRLGDGAGGFGPASIFDAGVTATALDVGDINADGKKDVALAGPGGAFELRGVMRVLAGDGAGGFGPAAVFRVGVVETTAVVVGDFDGDARGDAAAVSGSGESPFGPTPGAVAVFLGDAASGALRAPLSFPAGSNPFALATGDINADGRLDLAVSNFNTNPNAPTVVNVMLGDPPNVFGPPTAVNVGAQPRSVTLADVNGDGKLDLLTANRDSFNVSVLLGDGAGGFGQPRQFHTSGQPLSLAVADFNLDARQDLAVTNASSNSFALLLGDGAGGFGQATTVSVALSGLGRLVAGDFNRDGRADLAAGNFDTLFEGLAVMLGNGAGGFTQALVNFTGARTDPLVVGDFNNDGRADIAGVLENAGQVVVFYGGNGSNGLGGGGRTLTVGFETNSITAADFDGDGDTDLATSSGINSVISLFASDGAGDFAPPVYYGSGGPTPRALITGDFDGDGASDIAVANQGDRAGPFPNPPPGSVTVLVNNCDDAPPAPPRLTIEGGTVNEGNSGTTNATFTVRLSATSTRPVSVSYYAVGQTATLGTDFQQAPGRVTFNPGEVFKTVTVPVVGDNRDEFDETFTLALAFPLNAVVDASPASVTIVDNDPEPSLSVSDVTLTEGSGASTAAVFTVSLSAASGKPVTVAFATSDGTAQGGPDYQTTAGALAFSPGERSKTVSINVVADSLVEPDETFLLNLSDPTNATLNDAQGAATVRNDDAAVQFAAASVGVTETKHLVAALTVTRTGQTTGVSSVAYATADGTATERRDYTAAVGRLHFAANETSKTIEVVITDDRYAEPGESFTVTLSGATGAELGAQSTATVTINSDDATGGPSPVKDASFDTEFFVRQHYADFLGRLPDEGGLQFWMNGIESCGADLHCREVKKIDTSAAFFLSIEFQETGFLAVRTHKAAFGDLAGKPVPIRLRPFLSDSRRLGDGVNVGFHLWSQRLEENKQAYFAEFVAREDFIALHPPSLTAEKYVNGLFARAGVLPTTAERQAAINAFGAGGTSGRAAALRSVAESQTLKAAETNKAFVLMQYFGYLRRNPDDPQDTNFDGFSFWLNKLNQFNGNYVDAEMVKAFIQSIEYGDRFGH